MPSSHAANAFGQAVLFSFYFRKAAPYLLIFASLVALSRVFVGVHYPGDITAGALLGAGIGLALGFAHRKFIQWRESNKAENKKEVSS
ncbi:MAG: phosphatase PAP2 family protein, partial [bacterium]|nr:phosphatase PAP2 family protein [bacterium]